MSATNTDSVDGSSMMKMKSRNLASGILAEDQEVQLERLEQPPSAREAAEPQNDNQEHDGDHVDVGDGDLADSWMDKNPAADADAADAAAEVQPQKPEDENVSPFVSQGEDDARMESSMEVVLLPPPETQDEVEHELPQRTSTFDKNHHHHHHHGEGSSTMMPLYSSPKQRQRWGDKQLHPSKNWGDIFFDLFYVAAFYNLGHLLREDPTPRGLLYLVGCFCPIIGLWLHKLVYDARFYVGEDLFHRFYEVAVFLAVASAILQIRPLAVLSHPRDFPGMFAFATSLAVACSLAMGRFLEVCLCQRLFAGSPRSQHLHPEAFWSCLHMTINCLSSLVFYIAAAIYSGLQYYNNTSHGGDSSLLDGHGSDYYGSNSSITMGNASYDYHDTTNTSTASSSASHRLLAGEHSDNYNDDYDDVAIWLLLAGALASSVSLAFLVLYLYSPQRGIDIQTITVPMNIGYCIHRYGEWTMLLLGESVLSLLIVQYIPSENYLKTFYCGILSIALLQYLHFRSQPHDPDEHALRRSRVAGYWFSNVFQVFSVALVILGTCFKMFLYEYVYEYQGTTSTVEQQQPNNEYTNHRARRTLLNLRWLGGKGDSAALRFDTSDRQKRIAVFFCASLALVWFCMDVMLLLHRGIQKHEDRIHSCTWFRCIAVGLLLASRVALIAFMATFWLIETYPGVLSIVGLVCIIIQLVMREVGDYLFCCDHEDGDDNDSHHRDGAHTEEKSSPT